MGNLNNNSKSDTELTILRLPGASQVLLALCPEIKALSKVRYDLDKRDCKYKINLSWMHLKHIKYSA